MLPEIIGERFELRRAIGSGAVGKVFEAWDHHARILVALKLLDDRAPRQAQRFEREAAILATLSHPCIVRYLAHGIAADGRPYLAMEWLEGETLASRLAREGRLSAAEVVRLGLRVAQGLTMAHRSGIVHRDIKPANLFLCGGRAREAKIADFGIARQLFEARGITQPGVVVGTPMYMSPEQARGACDLDARSDVFSLGGVLYESLTGEAPFAGAGISAILAKILLDEPTAPGDLHPELPASLDQLLFRMLAKDLADRPSAQGVFDALSSIAEELAISADSAPRAEQERRRDASVHPGPRLGSSDEPRVRCALLLAGDRALADTRSATASMSELSRRVLEHGTYHDAPSAELASALAQYGARLDRLLDGSMVVTMPGALSPTEQVASVARCALSLRRILPTVSMAICASRAGPGGRASLGSLIDRGTRLLVGASPGSIRLDPASAGLLDGRFELVGTAGPLELGSERPSGAST